MKTPTVQKLNYVYADWIQPEQVTDAELVAIREYLLRRASLPRLNRQRLVRTIGAPIAQRMTSRDLVDYDVFLEEVYALKMGSGAE